MRTNKDHIRLLRDNLPEIQRDYGVTSMMVFGSVARGDYNADSDVDLLVDMPPKIFIMSALKQHLEELLNCSVDLIRRHSHLSSDFISQINRDAVKLL